MGAVVRQTKGMTDSGTIASGGHRSRPRQGIGALIGAIFGLVFIEANSAQLPDAWRAPARVGGVVVFVALLAAIGRPRRAGAAPPAAGGPAFGRGYWLIVAAEAAALVVGIIVINALLGARELTVAWIALVVGVHFFGLGVLWKAAVFHGLGVVLTLLGIAGFALHGAGAPDWAVALVSGVAAGVALDLAAARWVYSTAAGSTGITGHPDSPG